MDEGLAQHDRWSSGEAYERYVGRWSRPVARDFVAWLALGINADWLDVGCGTGALTEILLAQATPARVEGIDASEAYVATARAAVVDKRVAFRVGDAQELPFRDGEFDAAVSGLVLNFVPDGRRMVSEMRRVVKGGGTVAVYVWDYAGEMQLMRRFWDAAMVLDPGAAALDEGSRFSVTRPESLKTLFEGAGLGDVSLKAIDVPTHFRSFDDYWQPFLGGNGAAPGYCMSLSEERRAALRERLRSTLPVEPDGSIRLSARAQAVKGRVK